MMKTFFAAFCDVTRSGSNHANIIAPFLFILLMLISRTADAQFYDGNKLFDVCTANRADSTYDSKWGECVGYVTAIADLLLYGGVPALGWNACVPAGATIGQIRDVVIQYLYQHPEMRHQTAIGMTAVALRTAFPCR
jgi:hypothetical protein